MYSLQAFDDEPPHHEICASRRQGSPFLLAVRCL